MIDASNDWKIVTAELGKSFGREPHLISLDSILSFGRNIGDLADEPMKSKSWIGVLLGLPFDVLRRTVARQPAVELHRLWHDLPGHGRLHAAIERLFGPDIASTFPSTFLLTSVRTYGSLSRCAQETAWKLARERTSKWTRGTGNTSRK